ncbi:SDR family NAD(P)-dependent oxidoreductase [Amycolatopsis sp. NPDC005232]|uniref:SDR family NAD(P)-dependent oxidoreductase n=1 Tax=Amycolatopsis sp. NPDC005232 TaxID=3157027 RepID=UPI0033BCB27B
MTPPIAIVTGGVRNLGRAIALALAADGFGVVVTAGSDHATAQQTAGEIAALGVPALGLVADVADPAAVAGMVERAAELGPVRVLVNNAALRTRVPFDELTLAEWAAVRSVTLDGAFHCAHAVLPHLRRAGGGRIVSMIGANALRGDPSRVHLSAAKHGVVGLTKALSAAYAAEGITVNAVSPGRMNAPDAAESELRRERVAATVAFLASPAAGHVTGQLISAGPPEA